MRTLRQVALGLLVLVSLRPSVALAQAWPYQSAWDDFYSGLLVGQQPGVLGTRWFYASAGPYLAADAQVQTWGYGLTATSLGRNSTTGMPAFTYSLPPDLGIPGQFDHMKWAIYMNHVSTAGQPGFDAQAGMELACETWISGQTYGTEFHPFGARVQDPQTDPRLASYSMNTFDMESGLAFDFLFTNNQVYALYERLPYARAYGWGNYAAFTYVVPVGANSPGAWNRAKISYSRSTGAVRWFLNGVQVFQVTQVGYRIDRQYMLLDHGGTNQLVSMNQLNCGMGMFTLLDGVRPQSYPETAPVALVRLNTTEPGFYFNPSYGEGSAWPGISFVDTTSTAANRLFGQGARMEVYDYEVTNTQQ
jgi:uncharacterized protein DUF6081